ncbi:MAG: hypothetical protein RMK29_11345 [Myxococcales bacterium]|nr:hypothetical protein [Myxococcota bacterium]MDW8282302.1 hypothetical protein [Myxococcales bacterium]
MFISIRHIIDRLRHPRSRPEELARLRGQLLRQPRTVPPAEAATAQELARLRQELAAALGTVRSCRGPVATPIPMGAGRAVTAAGRPPLTSFTTTRSPR